MGMIYGYGFYLPSTESCPQMRKLTPTAKLVYGYLAYRALQHGEAAVFAPHSLFVNNLGLHQTTVSEAFRLLQKAGLIAVTEYTAKGAYYSVVSRPFMPGDRPEEDPRQTMADPDDGPAFVSFTDIPQ